MKRQQNILNVESLYVIEVLNHINMSAQEESVYLYMCRKRVH